MPQPHRSFPTVLALAALPLWACDHEATAPRVPPDVAGAVATITAADVAGRVGIIADDSMGGRNTPSPGLEATASYMASELEAMGLEASGTGYIQRYPFAYPVRDDASLLLELAVGQTPALEVGRDLVMFGAAPERGDTVGRIVWGGPASDPEAPGRLGVPLAGRVVLYDLPVSRYDLAAVLATTGAQQAAIEGDAAAIGFVVGPGFGEQEMAAALARSPRHERWIPEFWIRQPAAEALLSAAGADLASLRSGAPRVLDDSLRVRALLAEATALAPNVVAVLPGSDPSLRAEYVVVSAHYDHLGIGLADATGDSIYNGADDNGSGTTAVLEVAEAMASLETPPARSLLFLLVSGEERGLIGSSYFARHPTVPLSSIVADINLDMVGRNDPAEVIGVGSEYTSLGDLATSLARDTDALGLSVLPDLAPDEHLFFRSDQLVFACREIPSLFFTDGGHADYHTVSDEVDRLDTDKIARVARLAFYLAYDVADAKDPPTWTSAGRAALSENVRCP